jgi:putative toxin-antitoxin system antitoxin component (TIGR02293 family)
LIIGEKFMSAKPLAEAYEKLKELRRQGESAPEVQSRIGQQLREIYSDVVRQGVPDRFAELIRKLDTASEVAGESGRSANLVRNLEIKTLADRIFGDEEKAEAWLHRPNASLSGQRPMDLLKDELGTAVVREMLEQIDHGIFA